MKYLKKFNEELENNQLKIDDYVICEEEHYNKKLEVFINNNIGQCITIDYLKDTKLYGIVYENIPKEFISEALFTFYKNNKYRRNFWESEIKAFSIKKEDLEHLILVNKYNL